MKFDDTLRRLEAQLDVPYPERARLLAEIAADLEAAWAEARRRGRSDEAARAEALAALGLDDGARAALADVHRPPVGRLLSRLRPWARAAVEWATAVTPLAVLIVYLILEVPMMGFIEQGGWGMYPVFLFGGLALIAATRRAFRWLVARDHSPAALALDDGTPVQLALLTFLAGMLGTCTGAYKVLSGNYDDELTRVGLMESLTVIILACALAALTLLVDVTARTLLRRTGAPKV